MKSVDEIIKKARYRTKNANFLYVPATGAYSSGISTELFLDFLNDAQDRLQSIITQVNSNLFVNYAEISLVGNQADYEVPDRVFGGTNILSVSYNSDNNSEYYTAPLSRGEPRNRAMVKGTPNYYVPYSGKIALGPIPDSSVGRIKVEYYRELDDLDIRRGQLSAAPGAGATIVLAAAPVPDQYQIENSDYICISDRFGNVMMRNGVFLSYNSGTRTITLAANVSTYLVSPYTLALLDKGFITCGKYTTTHSKLPDVCERYLKTYVQKRVMTSADDTTSMEEDEELVRIENDILTTYHREDRDVRGIPIIDPELME